MDDRGEGIGRAQMRAETLLSRLECLHTTWSKSVVQRAGEGKDCQDKQVCVTCLAFQGSSYCLRTRTKKFTHKQLARLCPGLWLSDSCHVACQSSLGLQWLPTILQMLTDRDSPKSASAVSVLQQ